MKYNLFFMMITSIVLCLVSCHSSNTSKSPVKFSGKIEQFYVTPTRIIKQTSQVENAQILLKEGKHQAYTGNNDLCVLENDEQGRAFIILDFGQEWQGGVSLITGMNSTKEGVKVRIRLGESVSEAMCELGGETNATNDHAIRDWVQYLPWCGKVQVGNSGFRFMSLELLDDEVKLYLREISAIATERNLEYKGSFESSDSLLNQIWRTGARTVHLNMQDYLWDGIKRDRLVWVGDMHPEVMTILSVFGDQEVVTKSLEFIKETTPLPKWMNGISSYSMWWLIIHYEWYMHNGNLSLIEDNRDYILQLLDQLSMFVDKDGSEKLNGVRFLDWPTKSDSIAVHAGLQSLMVITFDVGTKMAELLGDDLRMTKYQQTSDLLRKKQVEIPHRKSPAALMALSGIADPTRISQDYLLVDSVSDLSTFYGYYVLNALAKSGHYEEAMKFIQTYWGGMLQLGATTFWEDFDTQWMENAARIDEIVPPNMIDIHSTYGNYCYMGYRHSLCHGWASGPTAWLTQYVLGVEVLEPGCKVLNIDPHLGRLDWVKGTYPTPYGIVYIEHKKRSKGGVMTKVNAPNGVKCLIYK